MTDIKNFMISQLILPSWRQLYIYLPLMAFRSSTLKDSFLGSNRESIFRHRSRYSNFVISFSPVELLEDVRHVQFPLIYFKHLTENYKILHCFLSWAVCFWYYYAYTTVYEHTFLTCMVTHLAHIQ